MDVLPIFNIDYKNLQRNLETANKLLTKLQTNLDEETYNLQDYEELINTAQEYKAYIEKSKERNDLFPNIFELTLSNVSEEIKMVDIKLAELNLNKKNTINTKNSLENKIKFVQEDITSLERIPDIFGLMGKESFISGMKAEPLQHSVDSEFSLIIPDDLSTSV